MCNEDFIIVTIDSNHEFVKTVVKNTIIYHGIYQNIDNFILKKSLESKICKNFGYFKFMFKNF